MSEKVVNQESAEEKSAREAKEKEAAKSAKAAEKEAAKAAKEAAKAAKEAEKAKSQTSMVPPPEKPLVAQEGFVLVKPLAHWQYSTSAAMHPSEKEHKLPREHYERALKDARHKAAPFFQLIK